MCSARRRGRSTVAPPAEMQRRSRRCPGRSNQSGPADMLTVSTQNMLSLLNLQSSSSIHPHPHPSNHSNTGGSHKPCPICEWHCSVCNSSFGSGGKGYTRCAQHASSPRCHCYQISQGQARAAPQLVRTVFRSADRNVGDRQHQS